MPMRHDKPCGKGVECVNCSKHETCARQHVTRMTNIPSVCGFVNIVLAVVKDSTREGAKSASFLKTVGRFQDRLNCDIRNLNDTSHRSQFTQCKESRLLSVQPILDADVLDCRPVDLHSHTAPSFP